MNAKLREALVTMIKDSTDVDSLNAVITDFSEEQRVELADAIDERRAGFESKDSDSIDLQNATAAEIAALLIDRPEVLSAVQDLVANDSKENSCKCGKDECDCGEDNQDSEDAEESANDSKADDSNIEDSEERKEGTEDSKEDENANTEDSEESEEGKEGEGDDAEDSKDPDVGTINIMNKQPLASLNFKDTGNVSFVSEGKSLLTIESGAYFEFEAGEGKRRLINTDTGAGLDAQSVEDFANALTFLTEEQRDHVIALALPSDAFVNTIRSVAERLAIDTEDLSVEQLATAIDTKVSTTSENVAHNTDNNEPRVADTAFLKLQGF